MIPLDQSRVVQFLEVFPEAIQNESMARHTNIRIGGSTRLYFVASSSERLIAAVETARKLEIPWYVFGGGSNLLVADQGFEGVMIQHADHHLEFQETRVIAAAGVITSLVARQAAERGLAGFEWAVGVPGTIGGAVYGNAGCYGGEMKDVVVSVDVFDIESHRPISYSGVECDFDYRESRFKHQQALILNATLQLPHGEREKSLARIKEIIELRKVKQPLEFSSAGCLFKNADIDEKTLVNLSVKLEIPDSMKTSKRISAGWLVQQAGLSGFSVGDAQVSEKHGNFLLNRGKATAENVLQLASAVKTRIRDEYGILLEDEVQLVGFEA